MCDEIEFLWIQGKSLLLTYSISLLIHQPVIVILAILQRLLEHVRFHHCLG